LNILGGVSKEEVGHEQRWPALRRTFAIFLLFWTVYGITTNARNGRAYNLQQMGVDAIVVHHTFEVGLSKIPRLKPNGDVFSFGGRTLAAKQPGQFFWGSIPYFFLHSVGITYEADYELSASLVTWFSAGLFAAAALALLDRMMWRYWGFSRRASLFATLATGFASYWFAYAGVSHHDVLAGSLLIGGLYGIEGNRFHYQGRNLKLAFGAGILLGLVIFTSMLPALIVAVVGIYVLATLPFRTTLWCGAGFLAGLMPLFAYNSHYFGSPLLPANLAGNYSDTFWSPGWSLAREHLNEYFGTGGISIWRYAPAEVIAFGGLFLLPPRTRCLLVGAVAVHVVYLISIPTLGGCEYGPRYLLPLLPLLAPGLAALFDYSPAARPWIGVAAAYGFFVSAVGAVVGTMYCTIDKFALGPEIAALRRTGASQFPLLTVSLLLPVVGLMIWRAVKAAPAEPVQ
jgi:hypothetical protein